MSRIWTQPAAGLIVVSLLGGLAPAQPPAPAPPTKKVIELPTKQLIAAAGPAAAPANPHVKPGNMKWHKSFAAACAAAKKSGKPVFLFQMLGRLDQEFT